MDVDVGLGGDDGLGLDLNVGDLVGGLTDGL